MSHQYRIIVTGSGYADCSDRGRIRLDGPDALPFLQALVSNDVARLAPGTGVYATYLTPQGRMLADLEVYHRGTSVLCSVASGVAPALATRLDQSIFAEDTRVTDVSAEMSELSVVGGSAAALLGGALGLDAAGLSDLAELAQMDFDGGFVARSGEAELPSYRVFIAPERRDALVTSLESRGAVAVSRDLMDALRIAHGRGAWGAELTEETIPLEAGLLDRAISTTKGCYVGQEIIIRILHRGGGRVAKRLVRLASDDSLAAIPSAGALLVSDAGADVGRVTSVAPALDGGGWIALAYLARDHAEVGKAVTVKMTAARAIVTALGR